MDNTIQAYIAEFNQLYKEFDAVYHSAANRFGLSDCAFWILYMLIDAKEPIKQSELSDNARMSRQTVNSALKKLEKDGYVTLKRIEGTAGKSIHLTEKGSSFVHENIVPVMRAEIRACEAFSEEEIRTFLSLFRTLVERMDREIRSVTEVR